jgi:hypothetical protein
MRLRILAGVFVALLMASFSVYAQAVSVPPLPPGVAAGSASSVAHAVKGAASVHVHDGAFDLHRVTVGQVVDLVYGDTLRVPHVISSEVLDDEHLVSFQFDASKGDLEAFMRAFLRSQGFQVVSHDGVEFIGKAAAGAVPVDRQVVVYQPRHRSAAYLAKLIEPLFSGRTSTVSTPSADSQGADVAARPVLGAAATGASAVAAPVPVAPEQSSVTAADQLVFAGPEREVVQVKAMLPELDTAVGEVIVRGWAYEVDDTDGTNSGFNLASKLLGVGVGVSVGAGATSDDATALQFGAGRLSFAISALNADSRFKEVSSPNVRCVSGQQVKLNVGQQVPTVGSVSYQGTSGTPVQSIQYQDAGVIFNISPTVMQDVVELKIDEEISSFASTTTGVSSSPTKSTRSLQTVADMKDGEVIVLGGLMQDQSAVSNSGERFLPRFLYGRTTSKARTEVVLVLQVQKL